MGGTNPYIEKADTLFQRAYSVTFIAPRRGY